MEMQSVCLGLPAPKFRLSIRNLVSHSPGSSSHFKDQSLASKRSVSLVTGLGNKLKGSLSLSLNISAIVCAHQSDSSSQPKLSSSNIGIDPFRGKSGSVSFYGLTHQLAEEGKLVSAPFQEEKGSFLWVLAPVALISSLIIPQFFLGNVIEASLKNETLIEIVASLCFESVFYAGVATFLLITNHVQRPYLDFSSKRWSLITGLRGYLSSAFLTMGLKVVLPLFAVYMTWPVLGVDAIISVLPFLVGCTVQRLFEARLEKQGSSCWPLIPIIFEVYRLYQLTRAASFIQRLMFLMKEAPSTPDLVERRIALLGMVATFQILGVVCLWSLVTFLIRLFPSRPVAENY